MQIELFEHALDEFEVDANLVNQVLEIAWEEDAIHIWRYQLPAVEP